MPSCPCSSECAPVYVRGFPLSRGAEAEIKQEHRELTEIIISSHPLYSCRRCGVAGGSLGGADLREVTASCK